MVRGGIVRFFIALILMLVIVSSFAFADENGTVDEPADAGMTDPLSEPITDVPASTTVPSMGGGLDLARSYSWLYDEVRNSSSMDVSVRALSDIALIQGNPGEMSGLIEALRDFEDTTNHCWPTGGCRVKDSALATLALSLAGQDVTEEVEWLKSARVPGLSGGEWWIVIKASNNGTCQFSYPGGEQTFQITNDMIRRGTGGGYTSGRYYINLNELSSTLRTQTLPEIAVGCDPNLLNPIITLIYKPSQSTFFIQRSDAVSNLNFNLANACFGNQVPTGSCNYESTAYATWALLEIHNVRSDLGLSLEEIGTHIYLESQALNRRSDPVSLGLLNRILVRSGSAAPSFIDDLVKLQRPVDGSWGGDAIATSIASFGLTGTNQGDAVARGIAYLSERVSDDGSWSNSIEATSWALIALHGAELSRVTVGGGAVSTSSEEICGNGIDDDMDGADDCAEIECLDNPICQCVNNIQDGDETGIDCGGSCPSACLDQEEFLDEPLESFGDEPEFLDDPLDDTVDEEGGSLWWLWVLIILILIGGGIFFYVKYVKTGKVKLEDIFKKKPKGPSFEDFRKKAEFKPVVGAKPIARPAAGRPQPRPMPGRPGPAVKPKGDDALEKSIREAQNLLKK